MEPDLTRLEEELAALRPIALHDDFLSRLDNAMVEAAGEISAPQEEVIVATSDPELASLEESLRRLAPLGMPEDIISRLDEAMQRWHEKVPVEEKVVPMHPARLPEKNAWLGIRSVAAVGFLGAALAFYASGVKSGDQVADSPRIPVLTNGAIADASFVPRDARASVVSANDHGVVWTKSGQAVRCVEVELKNSLEFENESGERIIIEKPKHEVRFFPLKFD